MAVNCSSQAQLWGSSWGAGWGGPPSMPGGPLPSEPPFTLFCVCGAATEFLSSYIDVQMVPGDAAHNYADPPNGAYVLRSADGVRAGAFLDVALPAAATLEVIFRTSEAPIDLATDTNHLFVGMYDDALTCFGLFLSQAGFAYGAAYDDAPLLIPESQGLLVPGTTYVLRMVNDPETEACYVYFSTLEQATNSTIALRFILPPLDTAYAPAHAEGVYASALGSAGRPASMEILSICAAPTALVDNFPPIADAGKDVARRGLAPFRLDGSASRDPENSPLTYLWRLVGAPELSLHVSNGLDGTTYSDPSGFVDRLYSSHVTGPESFPFSPGDLISIQGILVTIAATGNDVNGDYWLVDEQAIPENLTDTGFTLLRQGGFQDREVAKPVYVPDVEGLYRFQLRVRDAALSSEWSSVLVNVLSKEMATGLVPDVGFLWDYLGDTWRLLEDPDRLETIWAGLFQVLGGELLRLWQGDFSKSLKTIPRTIQRRWLNYDLLLREPFLDMTRCELRWGGVTSTALNSGGLAYTGQVLSLTVLGFEEPFVVTVPSGADTPTRLAKALTDALKKVEPRISVLAQQITSTTWELLLNAAIPFIVNAGTTLSIFNVGDENIPLRGLEATRLNANTLLTNQSLLGRGLKANDLIGVRDGAGTIHVLRVKSAAHVQGDTYQMQRILTEDPIPPGMDGEWEVLLSCTSPQLRFWEGGVTFGDPAILSVGSALYRTTVVGALEALPNTVAVSIDEDLAYQLAPRGTSFKLWGCYRRSALPVSDKVVSIPTLQVNPWEGDEKKLLREQIDYVLETRRGRRSIVFRENLFSPPGGDAVIPRFWAEETYLDNGEEIEGIFGIPVGLTQERMAEGLTDLDYLSAVRGLWFALNRGPRVKNLRIASQILLGLPFAEERGTILEIDLEYAPGKSRLLLQDKADANTLRSYSYPSALAVEVNPATSLPYAVGDEVEQFAPLVAGVEVLDYVNDPTWIDAYVSQGALNRIEALHTFLVRIDLSAYNLATLKFIDEFLRRVRPARTRPLFLVRMRDLDPDTVDVNEELSLRGTLNLYDTPYAKPYQYPLDDNPNLSDRDGVAGMFDEPDPSPPQLPLSPARQGRWQAAFDTNSDPADASPTHPVADENIIFGWDLGALSPEQLSSIVQEYVHPGGALPGAVDLIADAASQPLLVGESLLYGRSWVPPFGTAGVQLSGPAAPAAPLTVTYAEVRLVGVPRTVGDTMEVRIYVNGILVRTLPLSHNVNGTQVFRWGPAPAPAVLPVGPLALLPTDVVRVGLHAVTPARHDQRLRGASVVLGEGVSWTSGGALAAGTYYQRRSLLGFAHEQDALQGSA